VNIAVNGNETNSIVTFAENNIGEIMCQFIFLKTLPNPCRDQEI